MDDELPPGWAWARLGDICNVNPPTAIDHLAADTLMTFVPMAAVGEQTNAVDTSRQRPLTDVATGFTRFQTGDIIFAKITPCMENGKIAIVPPVPRSIAFGSTEFHVLRCREGVDPFLVLRFVGQERFRNDAKHSFTGGVGQQRVPAAFLREAAFPLPPQGEQRRIAAAVNALFAELDEAEAALARAREGVEQFRASLLHAACTGALTASWREANPPTETGADLLARILAERRLAWERAERARLEAKGTPPKNDAWKARYPKPIAPDLSNMPELPEGWAWVTLDHLIRETPRNGVSVQGNPYPPGVAALRLDALGDDGLRFDRRRYINIPDAKASALFIAEQDFLISRANGSPALVARACVAGTPPDDVIFPDTMIRFRFHRLVRPTWLAQIWKSDLVRSQILDRAKTSAGILKVSQDDLLAIRVPITSIAEQDVGLAAISELMDSVSDVDALESDRSRLNLRQSILHAAFTGRLVPQDPTDEPAAALLARLRATAAEPRRQPRLTRRV